MKISASILPVMALLATTSCASIIEGSTDEVRIATVPPSNASCNLSNSRGEWSGTASSKAAVKKSKSDLNVTCADHASGIQGRETVASDLEPWFMGNVALLSPLGLFIDFVSGAYMNYPDDVTVSLAGAQPQAAIAPAISPQPVIQAPVPLEAAPETIGAPFAQQTPPTAAAPQPAPVGFGSPASAAPAQPAAPAPGYIAPIPAFGATQ